MRHNDAHHNNSLVRICTRWNSDRNPFIYISCLPEGTKLRCVAAVLPLLLLQCWHLGWKQRDGSFRNLRPCEPAGEPWHGPGCVRGVATWAGCLPRRLSVRGGVQFLAARRGVHMRCGVSTPACARTHLTWEGWAGNTTFAIDYTSLCSSRKEGVQKYHSKT